MPTPELKILLDLGFIVITAAVFAFIGKGIRMPSLVGYIVAGMVLGPALQWVEIDHSLELISELGIALLLFLVGLELSLEKIRNLGRVGLILGSLQVTLTALGGFAIAHLLGMSSAGGNLHRGNRNV
jgi:Kef-type K+ transport system membrane component KefB